MTTESKRSAKPLMTTPTLTLGPLLDTILNILDKNSSEKKLKCSSDLEYYARLLENPDGYKEFLKGTPTVELPGYLRCIESIEKGLEKYMDSKDVLNQRYKEIALFCKIIKEEIEGKYSRINSNIFLNVSRVKKANLGKRKLENRLANDDKPLGKLHDDDLYPMMSNNQLF